jgi:hypothetical protein
MKILNITNKILGDLSFVTVGITDEKISDFMDNNVTVFSAI